MNQKARTLWGAGFYVGFRLAGSGFGGEGQQVLWFRRFNGFPILCGQRILMHPIKKSAALFILRRTIPVEPLEPAEPFEPVVLGS